VPSTVGARIASLVSRCHNRGNNRAFAVSDNPDIIHIDPFLLHKKSESCLSICCKIKCCCCLIVTGGSSYSAIIITEHGYASFSQIIGDYEKRLVPKNLLISVLRTRTRDQHYSWKRLLPLRHSESTRKSYTFCSSIKLDFFYAIRK